jgi:hypothetical protein
LTIARTLPAIIPPHITIIIKTIATMSTVDMPIASHRQRYSHQLTCVLLVTEPVA